MTKSGLNIFVAATRQHVGKTTVSLALMSGLKKRFDKVGFIKPVGQQHVAVQEGSTEIRVDKDCQVMKEYFDIDHVPYSATSPVIIPKGYTSRYIDGQITLESQTAAIRDSFESVASTSDAVLLEGTGHVGVGSIVELNNARVASLIGAGVVLVVNGGLGKAFDELDLNQQMLVANGVPLKGVVLNKVLPHKVDQVKDYMGRLLMSRWGVPLLGVVPDLPFLGKASLRQLEKALDGELIAGHSYRGYHYGTDDAFLVTTGLRRFLRRAFHERDVVWRRPLFVTHVTRDDLLLGYLAHHQKKLQEQKGRSDGPNDWAGALVLSVGASQNFPDPFPAPDDVEILPYLRQMAEDTNAPVLVTKSGTIDVLERIRNYTPKNDIADRIRLKAAIEHYEPHIDFDVLLNQFS